MPIRTEITSSKDMEFSDKLTFYEKGKCKQYYVVLTKFLLLLSTEKKFKKHKPDKKLHVSDLKSIIFDSKDDFYVLYLQFQINDINTEMDIVFEDTTSASALIYPFINIVNRIISIKPDYRPLYNIKHIDYIENFFVPVDLSMTRRLLLYYEMVCEELGKKPYESVKIGFQQMKLETLDFRQLFTNDKKKTIVLTLDWIKIISTVLRNVPQSYSEIVCDNVELLDSGFSCMLINLLQNESIARISITDCKVTGGSCFSGVSEALEELHPSLRELNFSNNSKIGDSGIENFSKCLGNTSLERLELARCGITKKGMNFLSIAMLSIHMVDSLRHINLSDNTLKKTGTAHLCNFLIRASNLKSLYIENTEAPIELVMESLLNNKKCTEEGGIEELDFSGCIMSKKSIQNLATFLSKTSSLRYLDLSRNKLDESSLKVLFDGLIKNKDSALGEKLNLTLILRDNRFDSGISENFISGPCRSVKVLDLSGSFIKYKNMLKIMPSLKQLRQLHTLKIDKNIKISHFGSGDEEIGKELVNLCHTLPSMQFLSVCGEEDYFNCKNSLNPFFESLAGNSTLRRIDVMSNKLGDHELAIIAKGVDANKHLRLLNVDNNRGYLKGVMTLMQSLKTSTNLIGNVPERDLAQLLKSKSKEIILRLRMASDEAKNRFRYNTQKYFDKEQDQISNEYEFAIRKTSNRNEKELETMKGKQFGVDLIDIFGTTKLPKLSARIPTVLIKMEQNFFELNGHLQKGIFRIAPEQGACERLKAELDSCCFTKNDDVHCIANLLKVWFRDLPERILNERLMKIVEKGASVPEKSFELNEENSTNAQRFSNTSNVALMDHSFVSSLIFEAIEEPYQSLFLWLLELLAKVAQHESTNMMGPGNIAIVYTPNLVENNPGNLSEMEAAKDFVENAIVWMMSHLSLTDS